MGRAQRFSLRKRAIEVFVNGGLLGSSWMQGYNGDAAELVHISEDGVAVVAIVHDRAEIGLEAGFG